ncbi:MFS transporter [Corynebacterium lizhenjunii]|uniref:MFS transporter n=1 Tax=Corynebacterium lizhenjunii TaxID=2709394 RepID=A0A7T0KFY9_9CORY|nr:MFS transporter [Corynebacterium lizhenjunii]
MNENVRDKWPVAISYLFSHLGYFAITPLLPLVLSGDLGGAPWSVSLLLGLFVAAVRSSSMFLTNVLARLPPRLSVVAAFLLTAIGFGVVGLASSFVLVGGWILLGAVGISINGFLTRLTIANNIQDPSMRLALFARINLCVNVAAVLGPFFGTMLYESTAYTVVFCTCSMLNAVAAIFAWLLYPEWFSNRVEASWGCESARAK